MQERPDEVTVGTAAALLGITERRLRQLAEAGFVTIHRRGFTSVSSAVSGYVRSLKAEAETSAASAAAARAHTAKASLIRAHTAKRRAAMTLRAEAEQAVALIADTAVRRLRDARLPRSINPATGQAFGAEVSQACLRIEEAKARALAALATGDLSKLDGGGNG